MKKSGLAYECGLPRNMAIASYLGITLSSKAEIMHLKSWHLSFPNTYSYVMDKSSSTISHSRQSIGRVCNLAPFCIDVNSQIPCSGWGYCLRDFQELIGFVPNSMDLQRAEKESWKPAVVDLPTPPFPDATAMMSHTPAMEGPPFAKALQDLLLPSEPQIK